MGTAFLPEEIPASCWFKDQHGKWQPQPKDWRGSEDTPDDMDVRARATEQTIDNPPRRMFIHGRWWFLTDPNERYWPDSRSDHWQSMSVA